jgi:vacuolar protein sorting-associated protein 33A
MNRLRLNSDVDHEFAILWVPRRTLISDHILETQGVLGDANLHVYPLFFIPLADDLLSLELDSAFGDLYLVNNEGVSPRLFADLCRKKTQHTLTCLPEP